MPQYGVKCEYLNWGMAYHGKRIVASLQVMGRVLGAVNSL